jgi:YidC/Oxa1 family membrane protein insertase
LKDPNERRALIAIVLCLAVFYVWSAFYGPKPRQEVASGAPVATQGVESTPSATPAASGTPGEVAAAVAVAPSGPCTNEEVRIETAIAHLGVDTCGGSVQAIELPGHRQAVKVTPWWTWLWEKVTGKAAGGWQAYSGDAGILTLLSDKGAFATAGRGAFGADGAYEIVSKNPLVLKHVAADGFTVTKTFAETTAPDVFDVSVTFESSVPLQGPLWVGVTDGFAHLSGNYDMQAHASAVVDGGLQQLTKPEDVTVAKPLTGPVSWFGVENRYFLAGLSPADPKWGTLTWAPVGDQHGAFLVGPATTLTPGQPVEVKFTLYVGPKYVERLAEVGLGFEKAANLGFWGFFSKILLFFLHVFQKGLTNWGLSIVALTMFVRVCFYPLAAKAFRSGKAMQEVQPLLKEIQEKYKDDKETQTRETMALFQKHSVNPLGGCFPLLLQMPVFFALYSALLHTPDLFQAGFLHVHDLSAPDPFGAFPFFMAVGMVLQQRMTPMTGVDPAQQQMMRMMPLVFALFMFSLPAGLSLYYALNTVLSILQQWYNTRSYKPVPRTA